MASDDKQTTPPKRRRRYRLFTGLTLLFLLLLISASLPWLAPGLLPPAPEAVEEAQTMQSLERRLATVERQLKVIAEEVAANTAQGPRMVPVASNQLWWIVETERYLVEADERLGSGGGVKAALPALKSAKHTLASVDFAAADAVKRTLDEEIRLLNQYRNENAAQALATIDALLERFDSAPVAQYKNTPDKPVEARDGASTSNPDLWTRITDTISHRIKHLVVAQNKSGPAPAHMTRGLVTQSLLFARTAALGSDHLSYRYAISNAMQILERHNTVNSEVYGELQALRELDITAAPPRIGKALRGIRALADEMNQQAKP